MKIAVIVPSFPVISETFIINHITGLIDEGHQVTIIALRKNVCRQTHQIISDYQLFSRTVFVKRPPSKTFLRRLYSLGLIGVYGLRFPLKMPRALSYLLKNRRHFDDIFFFLLAVISEDQDIYHFHFGQTGRLGAMVKKMGISLKMITSVHGADVNKIPQEKGRNYYSELFERGDHFVANTEFTKKQTIDLGCSGNKISVIPVGLNIGHFPFKAKWIDQNKTVQVLTVGRLVEKKGHAYSIRAINQLIKEGFNIHYTIAGDGPLRNELEDLTRKNGISEHVSFLGETSQEEVTKLYENSHLFVLSSITAEDGDKEGQGLVLQEAQACGLPVVSTLHNGIPDGVLDEESGYLVPEKDIKALSEALKKLLKNPLSWPVMGQKGRQFVENKYDIQIITRQMLSLYEML